VFLWLGGRLKSFVTKTPMHENFTKDRKIKIFLLTLKIHIEKYSLWNPAILFQLDLNQYFESHKDGSNSFCLQTFSMAYKKKSMNL